MKVLVTGSNGFIGQNLVEGLKRSESITVLTHNRNDSTTELLEKLNSVNFIYHLAGVNRSDDDSEFVKVNVDMTRLIVDHLRTSGKATPIIFTSSIQSGSGTIYGKTKFEAESVLKKYAYETGAHLRIYNLPNVFGKWSRPDYNSAVATFCFRVANNLEVTIPQPGKQLRLVYVEDVVAAFLGDLRLKVNLDTQGTVKPFFESTVGEVHEIIVSFRSSRKNLKIFKKNRRLIKYLKKTYLSFERADDISPMNA